MKIKNNKKITAFIFILLSIVLIPQFVFADEIPPDTTPVSEPVVTPDPVPVIIPDPVVVADPTPIIIPTVVSDSVKLTIRVDSTIIFSGTVPIDTATTTVTDNKSATYSIADNTVLGMLHNADVSSDSFAVSDLAYFSSFDSFLINCITAGATPSCYNWQYTVDDVYPFVGIDKYILKNNNDVYLYFGNQNRFTLATSTVAINTPLNVTTEKYDFRNNAWTPRPSITVGATTPDPNNPWSPIVVTSTVADANGLASLYFSATGTLNIGIGDDYYYPTQAITVTDAAATSTTPITEVVENTTNNSGGGGSGASTVPTVTFDIPKAIQFLSVQQNQTTGAIGSASLYSDWAAIAYGSYTGGTEAKTLLANYLKTDPNPGTLTTDWERRSMALMSLGINPYSGTKTDYITKILNTYKNNQFGDVELVNDDIFALFPLLKAGYTSDDTEIKNSVQFILSRQSPSGDWESPDLTAAAIQALSQVTNLPGVTDALNKGKNYLKTQIVTNGQIGGNTFSTSWAKQAITALGETEASWSIGTLPSEYLASKQNTDGGMENSATDINSRIWSTSYAIPSILNKTWPQIITSFAKPTGVTVTNPILNTTVTIPTVTTTPIVVPTSTVTSTITIVTSTQAIVTSTPLIVTTPTVTTTIPTIVVAPTLDIPAADTNQTKPIIRAKPKTIALVGNSVTPPAAITAPQPTDEPLSKTAKGAFGGAAAVAGSLAAYLAWRFIQGLV